MNTLSKKILEYTQKTKSLYLPYLWEKWGVEPEKFTEALCEVWYLFKNPRMVNNLLELDVQSTPDYYEVCNGYIRGNHIHKKNYWKYCSINQRRDQHVSVFSHDEKWIKNFNETGSVSCRDTMVGTDYIFLELDRETLTKATEDAIKFYKSFPYKSYCSVWLSGNRSTHIHVNSSLFGKPTGNQEHLTGRNGLIYHLAHRLANDLRYDNGIVDPWNMSGQELKAVWEIQFGEKADHKTKHELKQGLENIDPNLFSVNSLIRQPYSIHEKSGKRKIELPMSQLAKCIDNVKRFDINEKNSYITTVNKPFLIHWVYECWEKQKQKKKGSYVVDVDADEVISLFSSAFKYFDPEQADSQGWVKGLFNPLYDDTNPSVSVNINTGYVHDFGSPDHCMSFKQFKERWNENNNN